MDRLEGARGCARRPPNLGGVVGTGGGDLLVVAEGLVRRRGPEEAGELAGGGDGGDGRALGVGAMRAGAVVRAQFGGQARAAAGRRAAYVGL